MKPLALLADIRAAFAFLTILPVGWPTDRAPGWSFAWYPLVGLVIGAVLAVIAWGASLAALPVFHDGTAAFLVLLAWVVVTGGLHLDGFGDSCDGLLAAVEPARRLAIMKDPRTGSWAVVGLILLLLGKWTLIPTIPPPLLLLPPVAGRWVMVLAAARFRYARSNGIGGHFRQGLGRTQVISATVSAFVILSVVARTVAPVVIVMLGALLTLLVAGGWAARRLGGGLTGDVYGALCELTELICLFGFAWWSGLTPPP